MRVLCEGSSNLNIAFLASLSLWLKLNSFMQFAATRVVISSGKIIFANSYFYVKLTSSGRNNMLIIINCLKYMVIFVLPVASNTGFICNY